MGANALVAASQSAGGCVMIRTLFIAAIIASPSHADTVHAWANGASYIQIGPTDKPGAVAEVEFYNAEVHTDAVDAFTLTFRGLPVEVEAIVGRGLTPDDMTVTPPDGYIAVPPFVSVPENESRVIVIYTHEGAGM